MILAAKFGLSAAIIGMAVSVLWALNDPITPSGLPHTTSATCNTEPCTRYCRLCCLHFHPDNLSPAYLAFAGGCLGIGDKCGDENPVSPPGGGEP